MNIKKSLLTAALALGCMTMYAQSAKQITEYTFTPYWYGQAQIGVQETLGEGSFGKLLAPNAQITAGRQLNPLFGVRFGLGSWKSKGTMEFTPTVNNSAAAAFNSKYPDGREYWGVTYIAPAIDATFNLVNAIGGYNPERLWDVNIFAGIGLNFGWGNKKANEYNDALTAISPTLGLPNIWDGTKVRVLGRLGAAFDYRITEQIQLGAEFNANMLSDKYNSKRAKNADWYFNLLVGVKYTFNVPTWSKKVISLEPERIIEEKIVEKIVEVPVQVDESVTNALIVVPDTIRREVFFRISSNKIDVFEQQKVRDIAEFMKANPNSKVTIHGYADKGTGSLKINLALSMKRANAVADLLKKQYGIPESRMIVESMGEEEHQPYPKPEPVELNRVAICVVAE